MTSAVPCSQRSRCPLQDPQQVRLPSQKGVNYPTGRPGSGNIRCGESQSQTIPLFPPLPCFGANKKLPIRTNRRGLEKTGIWTTSSVFLGVNAAVLQRFWTGEGATQISTSATATTESLPDAAYASDQPPVTLTLCCGRPSCPTHPRTSQHTCGDGGPSHRVAVTLDRRSARPYWCKSRVEFQHPVRRPRWGWVL
jgi:hypothetical protein